MKILDLEPHEVAALLLIVSLGVSVYYDREDDAHEARELLDRLPSEHLTAVMRKIEAAAVGGGDE